MTQLSRRCLMKSAVDTEVEALLARCENLDLAKNIFVNGKWGSFR